MPPLPLRDLWFLTGPTASGKTAVGVELARRVGAEIVSMDSMALFRGMDIGTAKPSAEERRAVAHHLIDVLSPHEDFSLAQYVQAARQAVEDIRARGREVLFVGGTPLYLKGLLRGIFEGPSADWPLRRAIQQQAEASGPGSLHQRLAEVDPEAARRLHPNDTRRLIRALEVFEKTGRPISELQRQFDTATPADQCRVFVLDWPTPELHARIDRRVDGMFAAGLVEEVRGLLAGKVAGTGHHDRMVGVPSAEGGEDAADGTRSVPATLVPHPLSKTAQQAVGYCEVIEHLEGRRDLAETVELVKIHTRQLAKRQRTWFRSLSECRHVPLSGPIEPDTIAAGIAEIGNTVPPKNGTTR